jgi:predicted  nucleic acid-binding Zn-ribbon protein
MSDEHVQTSSHEVDRIRDIIFGTQMRDYGQQFDNVRRDLERLQGEIDHLAERLAEQDRVQADRLQALRRELRKADDDLRAELREAVQKLTGDKVDRMDLGQVFIEIGNYLKTGGTTSGLLKTLVDVEQEADRDG